MAASRTGGPRYRGGDGSPRDLRLALAQLPARLRRAVRLFRDVTGFSAVTSLGTGVDDPQGQGVISPPVHPRCASLLRKTKTDPPCEEQWRRHLRTGRRTRAVHRHVCPLGLRCSCVPILYGEKLVGIAKCVAGPETTDRHFSRAVQVLDLAVSRICQDFHIYALTEESEGLRRQVAGLLQIRGALRSASDTRKRAVAAAAGAAPRGRADALVDRTLDYIGDHYLEPGLSLAGVSRALGANDKYLTRLFTRIVGQHMHAYIVGLRVQHACRLLLSADQQIKKIAYESGFRRPEHLRRAFREHVGVAPAAYRRIFGRTDAGLGRG